MIDGNVGNVSAGVLFSKVVSLRSKRFRRVWEQRKTEERGFRYFACAENGARAKKKNGRGRGGEGRNRLRTSLRSWRDA